MPVARRRRRGALYPIETYPVVHNVEGLERGVYHYAICEHQLELVRAGDFRSTMVEQGLGQEFLGACGVVLFLTQILQRMRPKHQDRSYRYGLLEAGHIGENGYLAAVALGPGRVRRGCLHGRPDQRDARRRWHRGGGSLRARGWTSLSLRPPRAGT